MARIRILKAIEGRAHPGQLKGSARKKVNRALASTQRQRAAAANGCSVSQLRQSNQQAVNASSRGAINALYNFNQNNTSAQRRSLHDDLYRY